MESEDKSTDASVQPFVMRRYEKVEFPPEAASAIVAIGGNPVMAMVWKRGHEVAFAMVSDDPSGPNDELERHLSVSASSAGEIREPTHGELLYAAEGIGWEWNECVPSKGKDCVHIYRDLYA